MVCFLQLSCRQRRPRLERGRRRTKKLLPPDGRELEPLKVISIALIRGALKMEWLSALLTSRREGLIRSLTQRPGTTVRWTRLRATMADQTIIQGNNESILQPRTNDHHRAPFVVCLLHAGPRDNSPITRRRIGQVASHLPTTDNGVVLIMRLAGPRRQLRQGINRASVHLGADLSDILLSSSAIARQQGPHTARITQPIPRCAAK